MKDFKYRPRAAVGAGRGGGDHSHERSLATHRSESPGARPA